jgi:hypothetical protein
MYDTILVPLDGSKRAERILPYVEKLALGFDSKVVFLQVINSDFVYSSPYSYYTDAGLEKAGFEKLKDDAKGYLGACKENFIKGIQARFRFQRPCCPDDHPHSRTGRRRSHCHSQPRSHRLDLSVLRQRGAGVLHQVDRPLLIIRSDGEG